MGDNERVTLGHPVPQKCGHPLLPGCPIFFPTHNRITTSPQVRISQAVIRWAGQGSPQAPTVYSWPQPDEPAHAERAGQVWSLGSAPHPNKSRLRHPPTWCPTALSLSPCDTWVTDNREPSNG